MHHAILCPHHNNINKKRAHCPLQSGAQTRDLLLFQTRHRTHIIRLHVMCDFPQAIHPELNIVLEIMFKNVMWNCAPLPDRRGKEANANLGGNSILCMLDLG